MGACCTNSSVEVNVHKQKFLEMINSPTSDELSYVWWDNKKCGGPLMKYIYKPDQSPNDMEQKLMNVEIEYLFGGGYYEITATKDGCDRDVSMLMKSIDDYETLKIFRRFYQIGGPLAIESPAILR